MNNRHWLRAGGIGGILFVVLEFGFSLIGGTGEPGFEAPAKDWLTHYRNAHDLFVVAPYGAGLPMLFFLIFVGALYVKLRLAGIGQNVPSIAVLLFGGVASAMLLAAGGAGSAALLRVGHGLDESAASTLSGLSNEYFVMSFFAIGGLLIAAGLAAVRSHALPTWQGWSGIVIGLGSVIAVAAQLTAFWLIPFFLFYAWVVAVGVVLIRDAPDAPTHPGQ
jgi:hypothetical protein